MTATLTADYAAHLKARSHNRCWMLRLDLRNGASLGFTDHDQVLNFDLGDGAIDYRPDFGMALSDVQTGAGVDAGNYEVTFPVSSVMGRASALGGYFNRAEARLFQVVWSNLAAGSRAVMLGNCGEWRVEGDKAICEVRDQRDRLNQTIGRILQNQCDADYADQVRCFATPTEITGTITAVTSPMEFTVSVPDGPFADGFFDKGTVYPLTGANLGQVATQIWSWSSSGHIVLFDPLVTVPNVGDTFTVRDGCALTRTACIAHGQILNFKGFPEVPGQQALKPVTQAPQANSAKGK